jgi:hypothetical protein
MSYLDYEKLETIDPAQFQQAKPYPWLNPAGILTETGYQRLLAPNLSARDEAASKRSRSSGREHRMVEPVYKARRPKTSPHTSPSLTTSPSSSLSMRSDIKGDMAS